MGDLLESYSIQRKEYHIVSYRGQYYLRHPGHPANVGKPHKSRELAEAYMERLIAKTARIKRKCMTCSAHFMSEGAHNRMCDRCRAKSATMG